jgi:GT2 family glycosyltransferase
VERVVVVDDGSHPPLREDALRAALGGVAPLELLRGEGSRGVAWGRNRIAERVEAPYLLLLDDDAVVLAEGAELAALEVMTADPAVAAVAFAQADGDGRAYPPGAQPSHATVPALVRSFIGFAHLLRRDALLAVGGFRELLEINGEERELSLRLLDAGHAVVYLPQARVAHLAAAGGRADRGRLLFLLVRNELLASWLNEPLPLAVAATPTRLLRYFRMRSGWGIHDPGGFGRLALALVRLLPTVARERRAVRWRTIRAWLRLRASPPYTAP